MLVHSDRNELLPLLPTFAFLPLKDHFFITLLDECIIFFVRFVFLHIINKSNHQQNTFLHCRSGTEDAEFTPGFPRVLESLKVCESESSESFGK